ncbi:MAG: PD40 domain-containing protein [Bacteroidetes bacterium]|nr:PD40 domain-containing protein [Bacteroidota bacterium]
MMFKRKYLFTLFLSVLMAGSLSYAQNLKRKVKKCVRDAGIALDNNDFRKALELYQHAYQLDPKNAVLAFDLGSCMYSIRQYKRQSLPYFEQARKARIEEANYYLGNLYHLSGNFEDAIHAFQEYKNSIAQKKFSNKEIDFLLMKCKTAMELMRAPVNVTIENMGNTINSEFPDYVPLISADESVLIFTSRRKGSTGGLLDPFGEYFEDVYISTKKEGKWSLPQNIGGNINTPTHDACVGLSADGEMLLLYRTSKDLLSGDLYSSVFNGKDWAIPQELPSPINTKDYTEPSASSSADGQVLYFSSDRPGGYGKKDIYRVAKLPNGGWGKVLNLGPTINTAEDEDSPFIHPGGKTLYFSSKAHRNIGGYDIFKSTVDGDGLWSEPENLGYPVNTPDDDIYFVLSASGKTGYYSSFRQDDYGGSDIYLIHFSDNDLGFNVFKGKVEGSAVAADSTGKPLAARIYLYDSKTNALEGIYNTNTLTGKFIMILKWDTEYTMRWESEGYV